MKTITLEEIYADPRVIGALLEAGETAEILCKGDRVWILEPAIKHSQLAEEIIGRNREVTKPSHRGESSCADGVKLASLG